MKHNVFTQSEAKVWMECQQKWHFSYDARLEPVYERSYFAFGRAYHDALARWYRDGDMSLAPIDAFFVGEDAHDGADYDTARCRALARAYQLNHARALFEPLAVELEFTIAFRRGIKLRGRIDLIARKPDGSLWVIDFKTAQTSDLQSVIPTMDIQTATYTLAAHRLYEQGKLPQQVTGIEYHVVQKPGLRPTQRVFTTTYDDGTQFIGTKQDGERGRRGTELKIISVTERIETPEEFETRCFNWILEQDDRMQDFQRPLTVEGQARATDLWARLIPAMRKGAQYPNTGACDAAPGRAECPYKVICPFQTTLAADDLQLVTETSFRQKTTKHVELGQSA